MREWSTELIHPHTQMRNWRTELIHPHRNERLTHRVNLMNEEAVQAGDHGHQVLPAAVQFLWLRHQQAQSVGLTQGTERSQKILCLSKNNDHRVTNHRLQMCVFMCVCMYVSVHMHEWVCVCMCVQKIRVLASSETDTHTGMPADMNSLCTYTQTKWETDAQS